MKVIPHIPTYNEDGILQVSHVFSAFAWFKTLSENAPFDRLLRHMGGSRAINPVSFIRAAHTAQGTEGVTCPICNGYQIVDEPVFGKIYCFCYMSGYLNELSVEAGPRSVIREHCTIASLKSGKDLPPEIVVAGRKGLVTQGTRNSVDTLYRGVHAFLDNPMGRPMMIISAGTGVGKSHAAQALARYFGNRMAVYHSGQDWNMFVQGAMRKDKLSDFLQALMLVPLYIHDDWGAHHSTSLTDDNLMQVIANRYNRGYPTIVTTNEPLETLSTMDPRIASRFNGSNVIRVAMNAQDLRPLFE